MAGEHRMLEARSTERKLFDFYLFSLTMRQAAILAGPSILFMLFFSFLPVLGALGIGVNMLASLVFFGGLMLGSAVLAFGKRHGRTLDWHLWRWWVARRNPQTLLWRHRPPWMPEDHEDLRDSVQQYMPLADVGGPQGSPLARAKDGTRYLVLKAFRQPSVSLMGKRDRDRMWARSKHMLDSLDFEVVEILDSKEGHVTTYAETLREKLARTLTYDQHKLITFARQHLRHVEETVQAGNVYERVGYVVLSYNPRTEDEDAADSKAAAVAEELIAKPIRKLLGRDHPTPEDAEALQLEEEAAEAVLTERARLLDELYSGMGVSLRWLVGDECVAFLRGQATGEEGEPEDPHDQIVTHDGGDYERVPEHKRPAIMAAAQAAQERAPLAPASGF